MHTLHMRNKSCSRKAKQTDALFPEWAIGCQSIYQAHLQTQTRWRERRGRCESCFVFVEFVILCASEPTA